MKLELMARVFGRRGAPFLIALLALGWVGEVSAQTGFSSGQVGTVYVIASAGGAPGLYDFRVFLAGNPVICNGNAFAYVNTSDANYSTIVANVLSARALGATLNIAWTQQSNTYCLIDFIWW